MHLTLFIPDLTWPDIENPAAFDFMGSDTLARVLSMGERSARPLSPTDSWESRLAVIFGYSSQHPPLAALRAMGEDISLSGTVLCADPVNLDFVQQALVLSPIPANTLSDQDIEALLQSLNHEFAGEGRFLVGPPAVGRLDASHWYFVPSNSGARLPDLAACSRLTGRRIDADETRQILGREGLHWLNRIQMCLNQHPVNEARATAGLPTINSLWPWGLGEIQPATDESVHAPFSMAIGQNPFLRGLCLTTSPPLLPETPATHFDAINAHTLVVNLNLHQAVSDDDLAAWQTQATQMIQQWIMPALMALADRRHPLTTLTLISPNAHTEARWSLNKSTQGLRGNLLQRWLGIAPKTPPLGELLRSWSA